MYSFNSRDLYTLYSIYIIHIRQIYIYLLVYKSLIKEEHYPEIN